MTIQEYNSELEARSRAGLQALNHYQKSPKSEAIGNQLVKLFEEYHQYPSDFWETYFLFVGADDDLQFKIATLLSEIGLGFTFADVDRALRAA